MTTVKFDHAVKYEGVRYAAHEAFQVNNSDVDSLKQAGATVLSVEPETSPDLSTRAQVEEKVEGEPKGEEDAAKLKEDLLGYTVAEMTEFAQTRGIDLMGKTRKADIYNVIVANLK